MRKYTAIVGIGLGTGLILGHTLENLMFWTAFGTGLGFVAAILKHYLRK